MSCTQITTLAKEYKELQQFIKQLQEEARQLNTLLLERWTPSVWTPWWRIFSLKYTEYQTERLDAVRLRTEHADLCSADTKITTAKRFQIA